MFTLEKRRKYYTSFPQYSSLTSAEIESLLLNKEPKSNKLILFLMTRRSYLQHTTIRKLDSHARRVEIACKDAGCQFYYLALPLSHEGLVVKSSNLEHSCHSGLFEQEQ